MEALPSILLLKEYISLKNEEREEKQEQKKHQQNFQKQLHEAYAGAAAATDGVVGGEANVGATTDLGFRVRPALPSRPWHLLSQRHHVALLEVGGIFGQLEYGM